jgi:lactate dehydrogenase-like 2-hydroxyacid dehydrogenase
MKPEVFVACRMPPEFTDEMGRHFVVHLSHGSPPELDEGQRERVRALVTNGIRGAEKALIDRFPSLQIISSLGIGVDSIDLDTARVRGVAVTNTPGVVADDVADLAMAMLIDRLRSIVAGERFIRAGQWHHGPHPFARSLTGKRLGIVGLGAIGLAVAHRADAFKLRVKWYGPRAKPHLPYEHVPDLEQLARDSDALVIACSGGKETRHLIDARILAALGPSGVLVNVARGSIVDTDALIAALRSRQLAGAALDVFERQPEVPPGLLALDNVLLTPHLGTATRETRGRMADMVLESLLDHFAGRTLQRRVV